MAFRDTTARQTSCSPRRRTAAEASARLLVRRGLALFVISVIGSGCVSLNVYQPPETLDRGQFAVGAGVSAFALCCGVQVREVHPEIGARYGMAGNVDLGAKYLPPFGAYGDARWQFLADPVPATAGLGASVTLDLEDIRYHVYPSLAAGTDRFWVAGRGIFIIPPPGWVGVRQSFGLIAGTSFGDRWRLLPELAVYWQYPTETSAVVGLGVGVQFRTGR